MCWALGTAHLLIECSATLLRSFDDFFHIKALQCTLQIFV